MRGWCVWVVRMSGEGGVCVVWVVKVVRMVCVGGVGGEGGEVGACVCVCVWGGGCTFMIDYII